VPSDPISRISSRTTSTRRTCATGSSVEAGGAGRYNRTLARTLDAARMPGTSGCWPLCCSPGPSCCFGDAEINEEADAGAKLARPAILAGPLFEACDTANQTGLPRAASLPPPPPVTSRQGHHSTCPGPQPAISWPRYKGTMRPPGRHDVASLAAMLGISGREKPVPFVLHPFNLPLPLCLCLGPGPWRGKSALSIRAVQPAPRSCVHCCSSLRRSARHDYWLHQTKSDEAVLVTPCHAAQIACPVLRSTRTVLPHH
jgi:hypothetical protein